MDPNAMGMDPHLAYLMPLVALFGLIAIVVMLVPAWIICKKSGFTPWLSLLVFVPFGIIILAYILAFSRWKVVAVPELAYPPAAYPPAAPPPPDPNYPRV